MRCQRKNVYMCGGTQWHIIILLQPYPQACSSEHLRTAADNRKPTQSDRRVSLASACPHVSRYLDPPSPPSASLMANSCPTAAGGTSAPVRSMLGQVSSLDAIGHGPHVVNAGLDAPPRPQQAAIDSHPPGTGRSGCRVSHHDGGFVSMEVLRLCF